MTVCLIKQDVYFILVLAHNQDPGCHQSIVIRSESKIGLLGYVCSSPGMPAAVRECQESQKGESEGTYQMSKVRKQYYENTEG